MVLGHRSGRSFHGAVVAVWGYLQKRGEVEELKSEGISEQQSKPGFRSYVVNRPFAKCLIFATREEAEVWASRSFGGFYAHSEIVAREGYPDTILVWEEGEVTYGSGKGLLPPEGVRFRSELYPSNNLDIVFKKEVSPSKVRSYTLASSSWPNVTTALSEVTFCTRKEAEVWLEVGATLSIQKVTPPGTPKPPAVKLPSDTEVVGSDKEPNSCLTWKKDGIEWVSGFGALPPKDVEVRRVPIPPMLMTKSYGGDSEDCPRFRTRKESEVFQQISYLSPPLTIPSHKEPTSYLKGYDSTGKLVVDSRVNPIPVDYSDITFDRCDLGLPPPERVVPSQDGTSVPFLGFLVLGVVGALLRGSPSVDNTTIKVVSSLPAGDQEDGEEEKVANEHRA